METLDEGNIIPFDPESYDWKEAERLLDEEWAEEMLNPFTIKKEKKAA